MASRFKLQTMLEEILESRNVYYQPPESVKLSYPAIVYSRSDIKNTFADNDVYKQSNGYQLTVIDDDPDSIIVQKISALPMCTFNRNFKADNLNHDVFTIYY